MALACLATLSLSCAVGLDFDGLSNDCELPSFDVLTSEDFCTGSFQEIGKVAPLEAGGITSIGLTLLAGARDREHFVVAGINATGLSGSCVESSVLVAMAEAGPEGWRLERVFSSAEHGLTFVTGNGCQDANVVPGLFVTDVALLSDAPLRFAVALGSAGVVFMTVPEMGPPDFRYYGAEVLNPISKACVGGLCVRSEGAYCERTADCAPDFYCDSNSQSCAAEVSCAGTATCPDATICIDPGAICESSCRGNEDCQAFFQCEFGTCALLTCVDGLCSEERSCLDGVCQLICSTTTPCPEGMFCSDNTGADGICINAGGAEGSCVVSDDCYPGAVLSLEVVPPSQVTEGLALTLMAVAEDGLAVVALPGGEPFLLTEERADLVEYTDIVADVLYDEMRAHLYIALANSGVVRFDVSQGTDDLDSLMPVQRILDLRQGSPVSNLFFFGDYVVAIEGGMFGLTATGRAAATRATVLDTNNGLAVVSRIELGDWSLVSATRHPSNPDVWVFGLSDFGVSEFRLYNFANPEEPVFIQSLPAVTPDENVLPAAVLSEQGFWFVAGDQAIEFEISLD